MARGVVAGGRPLFFLSLLLSSSLTVRSSVLSASVRSGRDMRRRVAMSSAVTPWEVKWGERERGGGGELGRSAADGRRPARDHAPVFSLSLSHLWVLLAQAHHPGGGVHGC